MTLEQIKAAVNAGKTVHFCDDKYWVARSVTEQWYLCSRGGAPGIQYVSLLEPDGEMRFGPPEGFFIKETA